MNITIKEWLIYHISENPNINYFELVYAANLLGFYKQDNFVKEILTLIKEDKIIKMIRGTETHFNLSIQFKRDNKINKILNIN